jgi:hypothetical protein
VLDSDRFAKSCGTKKRNTGEKKHLQAKIPHCSPPEIRSPYDTGDPRPEHTSSLGLNFTSGEGLEFRLTENSGIH